jgi:two-component system sensor histidine kinase YcbA
MFNKLDNVKRLLIFGLAVFITGQIYIYPFGTDFRFSLSPVVFTFVLLYFHRLPIIRSAFIVAVFVFTGRFTLDYINQSMTVIDIIVKHYPGGMFYFISGLLFYLMDIRKHAEKPLLAIILLAAIDTMANVIELVMRNQVMENFSIILSSLLIVALIRNFIAVLVYWSMRLYNVLILKEAHYNRYIELLLFISNLKAELFYLRKSMQDIEKVMKSSYSMYVQINDMKNTNGNDDLKPYKEKALSLARDIHEIKKDYHRVITGIEKLLPNPIQSETMTLAEIFEIIRNNSSRYIEGIGKKIKLRFQSHDKLMIKEYYSLVSILNDLIFNAIDAVGESGDIVVMEFIRDNSLMIKITDNGTGIPEDHFDIIFEPGYSTKYNPVTGTMSTGLGLTHVKSMVEHLKGHISVESVPGVITTFTISIPLVQLTGEGE